MKANKKRKIFEDAFDLMTGGEANADTSGVKMIAVEDIRAFQDHPFRLYSGERLENMVESIKAHGVLTPVIVREIGEETEDDISKQCNYEMLAGHNRLNAARLAGIGEIPAIVKTGLSEAEAYVYVIETNVIQRSFAELLPSEKAAVMSEHYQKICGRMRREEILSELRRLNDVVGGGHDDHVDGTIGGGHDVHRNTVRQEVRTRDIVAEEYGFSSRNAARYLRINYLIKPFKDLIDDERLSLIAGVDLSYLTEEEQEKLWHFIDNTGWRIRPDMAAELRKNSGELTDERIEGFFEKSSRKSSAFNIRFGDEYINKYFKGMGRKEAISLITRALDAWFYKEAAQVG